MLFRVIVSNLSLILMIHLLLYLPYEACPSE